MDVTVNEGSVQVAGTLDLQQKLAPFILQMKLVPTVKLYTGYAPLKATLSTHLPSLTFSILPSFSNLLTRLGISNLFLTNAVHSLIKEV